MDLSYILADPSGNTTAFVLSPVDPARYGPVARAVMQALDAEQVAFVHHGRMDMMGGEFCGNASRCFALWQALHRPDGLSLLPLEAPREETVTVSGAPRPLSVLLAPGGTPGAYRACIRMPLPLRILPLEESPLGPCTLVEYPGISHLVLEDCPPAEDHISLASALLARLRAESGCFGLLYLEGAAMRPLVHVRDTGTLVWESSCASGTCAAAAALALRQNSPLTLELFQPGGSLTAKADVKNGVLTALSLDGPVTFPRSGVLAL